MAAALASVALPEAVRAQASSTSIAAPAGGDGGGPVDFDIPVLPLAAALKLFSQRSNLSVMAQSSLLDQHTSTAVHGVYTPRDALQRLLGNTGLEARFPSSSAAAIVPSPAVPSPSSGAITADSPLSFEIAESAIDGIHRGGADYGPYVASMQAALIGALCRSPRTRPGAYRLAVQLRIGPAGDVSAFRTAGSTGDATRDAAIGRAIRSLALDAPPPGMPQPVTILLRPAQGGVVPGCASQDGG
ncbi:secretin and TonB N terminus short domain protein [Burkholderia sp. Bp8963]|nr:secretin and TonB N terminus short domain protein [Burkholderia sp. Bp8963]